MPKFNSKHIIIVTCKVFESLFLKLIPEELIEQMTIMDYGLHKVPKKLAQALQSTLDEIEEPRLVILGFGLCGNGLNGLKAGKHTLLIPRADDCIAVLLGSYQAYKNEFEKEPGTYYLSKGWLEAGTNPYQEYLDLVKKYGDEQADWLMDTQYQHYKRLGYVSHSKNDVEDYREQIRAVADFCSRWGMEYVEIIGSENYIRELIEVSSCLEDAGQDFLVIPPGGEVTQMMFIR